MSYQKKHDKETTALIIAEYRAGKNVVEIAESVGLAKNAVLGIIGGNTKKTRYRGKRR